MDRENREKWNSIKEKWLKKDQLLILVLAGILLLVISLPVGKTEERDSEQNQAAGDIMANFAGVSNEAESQVEGGIGQGRSSVSMDYEREMEQRLLSILEAMEGVGQAKVMITLEASQELLLDKDVTGNSSETRENDSQGGERYVLQQDNQETTVLITQDGEDRPICVKTIYPQVEGVVVAAQGAGTGDVSRQISEMVQVLFGIDAHKVKIVKLE